MVSLQNFERFDIISIVNESTDLENNIVVDLFFKITLTVLMSISFDVPQKITQTQEREKQIVPPSHHFCGLHSY